MLNLADFFRDTVGLCLGSGGAKGISHIGVINFLEEKKIKIDFIAGSSIGALISSLYAFGKLQQFQKEMESMKLSKKISFIDLAFSKSGILKGQKVFDLIEKYIPAEARIEEAALPLAIVATEYKTGQAVAFTRGNVHAALRASISIPGIFVPMKIGDLLYIDGGVSNPLPIDVVRKMGASDVIAVNLHPVKDLMKNSSLAIEREAVIAGQVVKPNLDDLPWYKRLFAQKKNRNELPAISETIAKTFDVIQMLYVQKILQRHSHQLLIEPGVDHVTTLDFRDIKLLIKEGEKAARALEGQLKNM